MQVNLLQCQSGKDVEANLLFIELQLKQLKRKPDEKQLVILPECCLLFGGNKSDQLQWGGKLSKQAGQLHHHSELKTALGQLAKKYNLYLIAGTIPALSPQGKTYSRSYFFDSKGKVLGHYDKLHLFDVNIADNTKQYKESDTFCEGTDIAVFDSPFGRIGLAICYDLRFPELFRALRLAGAEIIAIPSAFTKFTGQTHWQPLLQARALDSQCFVLAANQWGSHNNGERETWGHSMIIDPWGQVISTLDDGTGWVQAHLNMNELSSIRQSIPIYQHNRFANPVLDK